MTKWDQRFMDLAEHVAGWSKDPSTKVGAVITDGNKIVSMGYNGIPAGVEDSHERMHNRDIKIQMVLHAEQNAILTSSRSVAGCTLYCWPLPPCSRCAAEIIQSGITRVVAPTPSDEHAQRWASDLSAVMFQEAGVQFESVDAVQPKAGGFPCDGCGHHDVESADWSEFCKHPIGPQWKWGGGKNPACINQSFGVEA